MSRVRSTRASEVLESPEPFFALSTDLLCALDVEGRFRRANPAWERLLGHPADQLLGTSLVDLIHVDDVSATLAVIDRLTSRPEEVTEFENRCRAADGTYRWLAWTGVSDARRGLIYAAAKDVTGRGHAVAETERLAAVVRSSQDAIVTKDAHGVITSWNRSAERLYGYTADEAVGQLSSILLSAEHADEDRRMISGVLAGVAIEHYETRRVRNDGSAVDVSLAASPIHDAAGQVVGMSVISRDVSAEKRAEDLLRASEARYRQIVETSLEGVWVLDANGRTSFVNERMASILGHQPEAMLGRTMNEFIELAAGSDAASFPGNGVDAAEEHDVEFRRSDGRLVEGRVSSSPFGDQNGELSGVLAMVTDVTRGRQAERAVQASRHQLQAIIDQNDSLIFVKDRDFAYSLVNRVFERTFGLAAGEMIGKSDQDLLEPDTLAKVRADDQRLLDAGERISAETTLLVDGEPRTYLAVKFPLLDDDGSVYAIGGVSTDITDRKRAEEALRSANQELEVRVASRTSELEVANAELEAFSYSVSHDLRAPLRTVSGFASLLEDSCRDALDDDGRRYLGLVKKGASDLSVLIDDLLKFAKLGRQPLRVEPLDPEGVARRALDDLPAKPGIVSFAAMPECSADPALLRQVYANLLSNALKFTRNTAAPKVEVGYLKREEGGQGGAYFVRDNGVGFDPRFAHKLFGVFQRLHRAEEFEGTGVGLAIVQRVIARHGGKVWAESLLGEGTTIFFTLHDMDGAR